MICRLKAAHVHTNLRQDDARRKLAEARDRAQYLLGGAKGFEVGLDLLIDALDGRIDGVDLVEVNLEQEALVPFACGRAGPLAVDPRWPGGGNGPMQPWPGVCSGLRSVLREYGGRSSPEYRTTMSSLMLASSSAFWMRWMWLKRSRTNCLRVRNRLAHLLGRLVGHEIDLDQPVRHQLGQPLGVLDIGIATRQVLHMRCVAQHQVNHRRRGCARPASITPPWLPWRCG